MPKNSSRGRSHGGLDHGGDPFSPGAMVVVTLANPPKKFWGMVLALAPQGLSMRGADLQSFEDIALIVKDGGNLTLSVVFFPMHRIERIDLDLPEGDLPSLSQRFAAKTKIEASALLNSPIGETADRTILHRMPVEPDEDQS